MNKDNEYFSHDDNIKFNTSIYSIKIKQFGKFSMMNQNVNETISFISKKSFVIVNSRKKTRVQ